MNIHYQLASVKAASILSTYVPNSEILFVFCDPPRRTVWFLMLPLEFRIYGFGFNKFAP